MNTQSTTGLSPEQQERRGTIAALFCYMLWGVLPIYWKFLGNVSSFEVICQRIIWCFVVCWIACRIMGVSVTELFRQPRARRYLIPSAILITINWSLYIYAVDIDRIVETAIGYYINPLVSIIFGLIIFKERLTPLQWAAVILCACGVCFFTVNYGTFPWLAIGLALSFGAYGAVKKKGGYPAMQALTFETAVILPFALVGAFLVQAITGSHGFLADTSSWQGWATTLLLIGAGPVTGVPLLLFAKAANSIKLSTLGFIQYVSPTLALLCGTLIYHEPFTLAHAVCFGCIWVALALVGIDSVRRNRGRTS